ncbi:MAG: hypothetical protein RSC99_07900, partial [Clostridiales bacterium]
YTGSLMGFLLGLDRRYSFLAFTLGVVLAATIVTLATVGFVGIADTVGWIAALILLAVVALVWYWFHRRKKKRNQK